MVKGDTTQGTGMFPEVDEEEEGPFSDWGLRIHDDHWDFLAPKRDALARIATEHRVDAKTAEALFFDVFCLKFSNFLDECLADVVSHPIDISGPFPLVKLPFWDQLEQSGQTLIDSSAAPKT